jgi:hypothetical protein
LIEVDKIVWAGPEVWRFSARSNFPVSVKTRSRRKAPDIIRITVIDEVVGGREEDEKTEMLVRVEWRLKREVSRGCVWDV